MVMLKIKIISVVFLVFCAFIEPNYGQTVFQFKGKQKKTQIKFVRAAGLIVLKTYLNNKGPFNFILDTGVGMAIITDPDIKDSLNLKNMRTISLMGLGKEREIKAHLAPEIKINIENIVAEKIGAAFLENDVLNLSSYAGIKIHGLIGYEFFNSFIVKTYFEREYLIVKKRDATILVKKGYKIPISIEQNKPYTFIVIESNDNKVYKLKMLIDSGAGHAMSLESLDSAGFPLSKPYIASNLGIGLGGKIDGFIGRVKLLKIGHLEIPNVLASFPSYEDVGEKITIVKRNGSIGSRLLNHYNVTYNYAKKYIYLNPRTKKVPYFEHDMSGLEISAAGEDFNRYVINKVYENSDAERAGLQVNDELLRINFKNVSEMGLEEILEIFKSRDGRNIYLELIRGNQSILTIVTLKKVI
jgi:hypothetical protein